MFSLNMNKVSNNEVTVYISNPCGSKMASDTSDRFFALALYVVTENGYPQYGHHRHTALVVSL